MSENQNIATESQLPRRGIAAKIVAGLLAIVALVAVWSWSSNEPSYQGKRLSEWLKDFDKPYETTFIVSFEDMPAGALEAVRAMGTESLPILLKQIQASDSVVVQKLYALWDKQSLFKSRPTRAFVTQRRATIALAALGSGALPALPRLEKLLNDKHALGPASLAMAYMGEAGVKALTNALSNSNPSVRLECLGALSNVQTGGEVAIPILITSLRDQDPVIQGRAALALAVIRNEPSIAIPALTEVLAKTNAARHEAAIALGRYGPAATSAVPVLLECLVAGDSFTRGAARNALKRIGAETNAIIAAVTNALTNADFSLRFFAINTLASFGSAASNATPALVNCLSDPIEAIHKAASNALAQIDAASLGRLVATNPIPLR